MKSGKEYTCVALLRGIMPANPNMKNEKLRGVFEGLGFVNVRTVLASGNVIFETESPKVRGMEERIEKTFPEKLGFESTTIIRRKEDLQALVDHDPFKDWQRTQTIRLNVTFLKASPEFKPDFPYQPENRSFTLLGMMDRAVFSVIDLSGEKTPDMMNWLEKQYGKKITTRTWKTVHRILKKMDG